MRIEMPNHSGREDIHFIKGDIMTVLSDKEISVGDVIISPHKKSRTHIVLFWVEEIQEKRTPMGNWKTDPPNLYKIKFKKELEKIESNATK